MKQPTIYDPYPNYDSAGIKTQFKNEGADQCVKPPSHEGPGTPEHIKRYRKSYKNTAGQTITHYGKVHDPLPPQTFTYGNPTAISHHTPDVLIDKGMAGVNGYMRELKEQQYARNKNEPLGSTISRDYKWPAPVGQEEFRFGVPTKGSESAKDVMYTPASLNQTAETKNLYVKSHGMYEAGEQKDRNYNWPVDKKDHVFGKSEKVIADEGRYCLQPEVVNETFPKTQIIKKNVEDFRDYNRDYLGKSNNLAQENKYVAPDHVYGFKPKDKEPWGAAKCITGESVFNQVREDEALGRATRHGFKNQPKTGDEGRVFGVPTIRSDIKKPGQKSVADANNYGDEPDAVGLLFPQRFSEMGVGNNDFDVLRSKEQIRTMFANIGYGYKPGKFEGVFMRAQELCGSQNDQATVRSFIEAIKQMDHLE